ncbi:MAG: DUF4468 domain-containing protein [Candidatus Marinimicrobia bacterium]|nr:DUF4468 domain-containing protein [Candidatus Neomarinimicrobiota bacterium]
MKNFFLLYLITILIFSCSSVKENIQTDFHPELRHYEKIIEIPNTTQDNLYIIANEWFVETFYDAESVIQFQDKGGGIIKGKYRYLIPKSYHDIFGNYFEVGVVTYSIITVVVKDNKAKINIDKMLNNQLVEMKYDEEVMKNANLVWNKLTESLENKLSENTSW